MAKDLMRRAATRRYVAAASTVALMASILALDLLYLRPGRLTAAHKVAGIVVMLLGVLTQRHLGYWHWYYKEMERRGCKPMPVYPDDWFGIHFLRQSAKHHKVHRMLDFRMQCFRHVGPTFLHALFPESRDQITTISPENVKAVLATSFDDWALPQSRINAFMPVIGRHAIFTVNGREWQHSRAMIRPAFVRDHISDMRGFDRHVTKLLAVIPNDGETRFDLQDLLSKMTTDNISEFLFGHSTDLLGAPAADSLRFTQCFETAIQRGANRVFLGFLARVLPDRQLDESVKFINEYVGRFIAEAKLRHEQDQKPKAHEADSGKDGHDDDLGKKKRYSFIEQLFKSYEGNPEAVRDQTISMLLAGRDTTSSALTYLFYQLSVHPAIFDRLRTEATELGTDNPTWEQLRNMRYLNWAIKEALRLNPPVATNAREAVRDTVLPRGGGPDGQSPVFVARGTNLRYQPWCMHRNRDVFGEDADEFRPERWEKELRGIMYEYLPFNAGPRICIGQQFAMTQMALITFRLVRAFRTLERADDRPAVQRLSVNTSMLYGCWVRATRA